MFVTWKNSLLLLYSFTYLQWAQFVFNNTTTDTNLASLITKSRSIPAGSGFLKKDLKSSVTVGKQSCKAHLSNIQIWVGIMFINPGGSFSKPSPLFPQGSFGRIVILATKSHNPIPVILPDNIIHYPCCLQENSCPNIYGLGITPHWYHQPCNHGLFPGRSWLGWLLHVPQISGPPYPLCAMLVVSGKLTTKESLNSSKTSWRTRKTLTGLMPSRPPPAQS